jgi:hypothetical protein
VLEAGAAAIVGSASSATPGECPTTDEIVAAVMAYEVESGVTVLEALRYILAAVSGVTSKTGDTRTFDAGGNPGTVRIAATVDAQGNRSSVTLT